MKEWIVLSAVASTSSIRGISLTGITVDTHPLHLSQSGELGWTTQVGQNKFLQSFEVVIASIATKAGLREGKDTYHDCFQRTSSADKKTQLRSHYQMHEEAIKYIFISVSCMQ